MIGLASGSTGTLTVLIVHPDPGTSAVLHVEIDRDVLDIELNAPEAAELRLDLGPGPERCNLEEIVNAPARIRRLVGIQRLPQSSSTSSRLALRGLRGVSAALSSALRRSSSRRTSIRAD